MINVVKLRKFWEDNWEIYEVDLPNWNNNQDYDYVNELKKSKFDENLLLESQGRHLILIPLNKFLISKELIQQIQMKLTEIASKKSILTKIKNLIQELDEQTLDRVLRKGIGEILTKNIESFGFKKVGSGGALGKFLPPKNWLGEKFEKSFKTARISRTLELSVFHGEKWYLSADVKGRFEEKITLLEYIKKRNLKDKDIDQWPINSRAWQVELDSIGENLFPKEIETEVFEIEAIRNWRDVNSLTMGYGRYSNNSWQTLLENGTIPPEIVNDSFAEVKPKGRVIKDPNKRLCLPISLFYRILSKPKDREHEAYFKKFTQLTPQSRNRYISEFFRVLEKNNLIEAKRNIENYPINFARPGCGSNYVKEYGRAPPLHEYGVEIWGDLKKIDIFFFQSKVMREKTGQFQKILSEQLEKIRKNTEKNSSQRIREVAIELHPLNDYRFLTSKLIDQLNSSCCPIIFTGKKIRNYREIKAKLTQERGIPVQVIREQTLIRSRSLYGLARTLIPQIITKTGGLPYKLSPQILDRALIIGLDKARDSSMQRPSASAGVAAVTPEGHYVSGASTPLELNTTDFINVDLLAPILLRELEEKRFVEDYEYVVILRDGSPATCRREVPAWKKYLEDYDKSFIFLASRKTHPFRIFPADIPEYSNGRVKYLIPAVLNSEPLPHNDFLTLTATAPRGTPKPTLYTVMENTTSLSLDDLKNKVLAQIISMSMLCWESPLPTSQPLPLHYADKLAAFTQLVQQSWNSQNRYPMFI